MKFPPENAGAPFSTPTASSETLFSSKALRADYRKASYSRSAFRNRIWLDFVHPEFEHPVNGRDWFFWVGAITALARAG